MITILVWFNVLVPYFLTFNFQVLCVISGKIGQDHAPRVLTLSSSSSSSKSKYSFCGYNRLNFYLLVHEFLCGHQTIGDSVSSSDIIRVEKQRLDNASNTIIGHLNINSFRNKTAFVEDIIKLFDVLLVFESKLDHTFPSNQFGTNGYKIFRYRRNRFGGGLILYINEDILCKPLQDRNSLQTCSVKKSFLEISKNSQENTCARVSFSITLQASGLRPATLLKKRLWRRCFPVNFVKFL